MRSLGWQTPDSEDQNADHREIWQSAGSVGGRRGRDRGIGCSFVWFPFQERGVGMGPPVTSSCGGGSIWLLLMTGRTT